MFRFLGVHPGPDITEPVAASLAATTRAAARQMLAELACAHLITEHRPFVALHHLLRAYAAEQASATDDPPSSMRPVIQPLTITCTPRTGPPCC